MWDGSNNYQESLTPCTVNDDIDEAVTDDSRCSNNQQLNMVKDTVKLRDEVLHGLDEIFACKRGSRGKYKKEFRSWLKEFGITRGSALVLTAHGEKQFEKMTYALISIPNHFSQLVHSAAVQLSSLGCIIVYLLHQEE
jgi:hypothetical protein